MTEMGRITIDIGCGKFKRKGIGIDMSFSPGVDIVADLHAGIPLRESCADEVTVNHVIEHLSDPVKFLFELHRVGKPGAILQIVVPHYRNPWAYEVFHKSYWNYFSLDILCAESASLQSRQIFRMRSRAMHLFPSPRRWLKPYRRFLEVVAHRHPMMYELWLVGMYPPFEVSFVLEVVKGS